MPVPFAPPTRRTARHGPLTSPDCSPRARPGYPYARLPQSTRTAGGSIIGQATAGYRPGERAPDLQLWMFVSSPSIKPMPHAGRRLHTRLVAAQRPPSVASCDPAWEEDRPSCRPFRQRPDSMQQAARGFACGSMTWASSWRGHRQASGAPAMRGRGRALPGVRWRGCLGARRQGKAHRGRRHYPGRPRSEPLAPGHSHPDPLSLAHTSMAPPPPATPTLFRPAGYLAVPTRLGGWVGEVASPDYVA
jgi:hypothetical protein